MVIYFVLQIIALVGINCELTSENVVVAINCGGDAYRDNRGILYDKVKYSQLLL